MSNAKASTTRTQRTNVSKIFRLPKGVYGFGDPCYLFGARSKLSDDLWSEVCEVFGDDQCGEVELTDPQGWFIWGTTAMGPCDGADGMPTSACPECKKNPNPIRKK